MIVQAKKHRPHDIVASVFVDRREPQIVVFMTPSWQALRANPRDRYWLKFDTRTGALLGEGDRPDRRLGRFLEIALGLHRDLFSGLGGELLLCAMAMSFVAALVSGLVVYGPFMRRLPFGTVRTKRWP